MLDFHARCSAAPRSASLFAVVVIQKVKSPGVENVKRKVRLNRGFPSRAALRQRPRLGTHNLALAVGPEVRNHADDVVQAGVGALVEKQGAERTDGVDDQAGLDGAVQSSAGEKRERPFPGECDDAEDDVDDLQNGEGLDGAIEVFGEKIPEDLGPEEGFERSGYLIWDGLGLVLGSILDSGGDLQAAAVRTTRRAQWFLINLPMAKN
jgi:hypothetical protein